MNAPSLPCAAPSAKRMPRVSQSKFTFTETRGKTKSVRPESVSSQLFRSQRRARARAYTHLDPYHQKMGGARAGTPVAVDVSGPVNLNVNRAQRAPFEDPDGDFCQPPLGCQLSLPVSAMLQ